MGAVLLALFVSTPAVAQIAEGTVRGFSGETVEGAIVFARTARAKQTGIDALTDAGGRFRVVCPEAIASLHVQLEGVLVDVPIASGTADDLDVSFQGVSHFTLRGRMLLPDGAPAAGTEVLCRERGGKALVATNADAEGRFVIHLGQPVRDVVLDPLGWRHAVEGPFTADQELDIDLRTGDRFFAVVGKACDERGMPVVDGVVQAIGSDGGVGSARTRADGSYTLWSRLRIVEMQVHGTDPRIVRKGPWAAASTVDLDARTHGLVLRVGRCVDAAGLGLSHTLIFGVDQAGPPKEGARVLATTGSGGWFRLMMPRDTPFLFAWREAGHIGGSVAVTADGGVITVRLTH